VHVQKFNNNKKKTGMIRLIKSNGVAILRMKNAPVNSLSSSLRDGILSSVRRAESDSEVRALLLSSDQPNFFSAGAEIREFKSMKNENENESKSVGGSSSSSTTTTLLDVIAALEGCRKPVVALVDGYALGGGLELALGCHYRLASPRCRWGLPEVNLGLLPGAGGTQRLPRLIGVKRALDVMIGGKIQRAEDGVLWGVFDQSVAALDDVEGEAVQFALECVGKDLGERRLSLTRASADADDDAVARALAGAARSRRGEVAPAAIARCVEAASRATSYESGAAVERFEFAQLLANEQSAAMQHFFFAQRQASKVDDLVGVAPRDIAQLGVVGSGLMGRGIAMSAASAGVDVLLYDVDADALRRALELIERDYANTARRGGMSAADAGERVARIKPAPSVEALRDVDMCIEAVYEDMALKKRVFAQLDGALKPQALLCSNTSYLNIDEIASSVSERRRPLVAGAHFFSPANQMLLLENVRGALTSRETLATLMHFGKRVGKTPVCVGVCHGFVGNRLFAEYMAAADRLVLEGVAPERVDGALERAYGVRMGPYAVSDLVGLDLRHRQRVTLKIDDAERDFRDAIAATGRLGQKNGRGFYTWSRDRTKTPDAEVLAIIERVARANSIERRADASAMSDEHIVEWLLAPLVNEAYRVVDERIAQRLSDVDVVFCLGYGFPKFAPPVHWAQHRRGGLERIRSVLQTQGIEPCSSLLAKAKL
jgi:3-hydroxyacyl-CoA dehydrogenase